jgi:dolichol-phosphate mannosyltransferase
MSSNGSLTILLPLYNESECLPELVQQMRPFLERSPIPTSVLFINDGSTDDSQRQIEKICKTDHRYHFIQFEKNQGLSAALKAGIDHADSTLVGYMDCDCQTSPLDFLKLLQFTDQFELVTGIRAKRNDGMVKKVSSLIANNVRRWMIDDGIEDTGCPLKIMRTAVVKSVPFFNGMHRFLPALIQLQGGKVKQIPVQHFPRFAGKSKYNLGNRLIKPFVDALAFRWMKNRYIRYKIARTA